MRMILRKEKSNQFSVRGCLCLNMFGYISTLKKICLSRHSHPAKYRTCSLFARRAITSSLINIKSRHLVFAFIKRVPA